MNIIYRDVRIDSDIIDIISGGALYESDKDSADGWADDINSAGFDYGCAGVDIGCAKKSAL